MTYPIIVPESLLDCDPKTETPCILAYGPNMKLIRYTEDGGQWMGVRSNENVFARGHKARE